MNQHDRNNMLRGVEALRKLADLKSKNADVLWGDFSGWADALYATWKKACVARDRKPKVKE